jgi:hypothetical protein
LPSPVEIDEDGGGEAEQASWLGKTRTLLVRRLISCWIACSMGLAVRKQRNTRRVLATQDGPQTLQMEAARRVHLKAVCRSAGDRSDGLVMRDASSDDENRELAAICLLPDMGHVRPLLRVAAALSGISGKIF